MVVQVDLPMEAAFGKHQYQRALNAVLLVLVTLILGYLGWVLPSAGGSLAIPTLIVVGIGCVIAVTWWISFRNWVVVISVIAITIGASIWTFAFSLPASLTWGSNATNEAQAALSRPNVPVGAAVASFEPCSVVRSGGVGPLDAPYQVCVASFTNVHSVTFKTLGRPSRGLAYTDVGASSLPDVCSRHLIGMWWMFTAETSGEGDCPIGYQFHGGP